MNFKKMITTTVVGLSLFAFAGTALADITSDINVYGASAQFKMWRDHADDYMTSQSCTDVATAQLYHWKNGVWQPDGKNAITRGTCNGTIRYFRVSSKASYDGILAMQGNTTNPYRVDECTTAYERNMIDEATCDFGTGECTGTKCVAVNVGASDTAVECFKQQSYGELNGPAGGGKISRDFLANPITWSGADPCKPLVVPFAFFVNNSVTKGGSPITNITRDNVEIIFNGQAYDWSDLADADGVSFDPQTLTVCMRHAGSGTHASLDAYLNSPLATSESSGGPDIWFNDGTSQMMSCIDTIAGAIGYADADRSPGGSTHIVSLNGVAAPMDFAHLADAIANGTYNFYGAQHLYGVAPGSALCTFASDSSRIADPWVASCEMVYERFNTCESFPLIWKGNTCP